LFQSILGSVLAPVLALVLLTQSACTVLPAALESAETSAEQRSERTPAISAYQQRAMGSLLLTPATVPSWQYLHLPGKKKVVFEPVVVAERPALRVRAQQSVSILRQRFEPALTDVGQLNFSWKASALPLGADVSDAERDDSAVRIVLSFDGDRSRLTPRTHRLSEMSRLLTGEDLPFATLMYVWSPTHPVGTVLHNPRTDRIRKLVVESGTTQLGHWGDHQRNVWADFVLAFGEAPGPLLALALMSDTDNTASRLDAWYGALRLSRETQPGRAP